MSCRAPKRSQRPRDTKEAREMRDEIAITAQALVAAIRACSPSTRALEPATRDSLGGGSLRPRRIGAPIAS